MYKHDHVTHVPTIQQLCRFGQAVQYRNCPKLYLSSTVDTPSNANDSARYTIENIREEADRDNACPCMVSYKGHPAARHTAYKCKGFLATRYKCLRYS